MKKSFKYLLLLFCISTSVISCSDEIVLGCTDPTAVNYNAEATEDNGGCMYSDVPGCTDPTADNYNANATVDDGSCVKSGCTDSQAENYDASATENDGSCIFAADKFIGNYIGSADCMGGAIIGGLSDDDLSFEIKSALDINNPNAVLFSYPIMGVPIAFEGTVEGDVLTVNAELLGLPFVDPTNPGSTIMVDMTNTGTLTYDSSNDSVTGTVDIVLMFSLSGATIDNGSCFFTGVKQ